MHSHHDPIHNSATGNETCEEQSSMDLEKYHRAIYIPISVRIPALLRLIRELKIIKAELIFCFNLVIVALYPRQGHI
jgi:hypothetical protein